MFLNLVLYGSLFVSVIGQEHKMSEPKCSRFEYEEKTLHKLIRLEFAVEQIIQEMKTTLGDIRSEMKIIQGERDGMKAELVEIKRERDEMKVDIGAKLRNQVDLFSAAQNTAIGRIQSIETNLTDIIYTPNIWFLAKDPADSTPAMGQVIVYSTVEENVGGGYDATTGKFTAPVQGMYAFSLHACVQSSHMFYYEIRTDKRYLVRGRLHDSDGSYPCSSAIVYTVLEVGTGVWVTVSHTPPNKQLHVGNAKYWNSFSGVLIHAHK